MKKAIVVLSLLMAAEASANRLGIPPGRALQPVASQRKAQVMRQTRGIFTLPDGSQWITHPAPAEREASAIAVTRFGSDGSARVFLLSDWLPQGAIPRGLCGQIYAVTSLTDGRLAVAGGWNDGRDSHNAIVILRAREDGGYDMERVIEVPGVSHIVTGPGNSILAVTNDMTRRDGGPLLTVFNAAGARIGTLHSHEASSPAAAAQNAFDTRLHHVADNRYAVYNPAEQKIFVFHVDLIPNGTRFYGGYALFIGDDRALSALPVIDIEAAPDGDVLVARAGALHGKFGTYLTVYGSDGKVKESVTLDAPWNHMISDRKGSIQGVVYRRGVELDPIRFHPDR